MRIRYTIDTSKLEITTGTPVADCLYCHDRERDALPPGDPFAFVNRMIVCPDCGNKRCPKATWHDLACTGSNEPGQPGSAYR